MKKTLLTVVCALFAFGVIAQEFDVNGDYKIKGKVGIGTTNLGNYKLAVKGKMRTNGITIFETDSIRKNNLTLSVDEKGAFLRSNWYTGGTDAISFRNSSGKAIMMLAKNENVGIGIDKPKQRLDVRGNIINGAVSTSVYGNHYLEGRGSVIFLKSYGNDISSYNQWMLYSHTTDGSFRIGNNSSSNTTYVYPFIITKNGNVGIGTTTPGSYKLAVEGKIGAREIVVTTAPWADFVFDSNYDLMSLSDLDAFIKENKHLPEIPTTKEVSENGVSVGEMNAKLLQKIEELTLHTIKQQKLIENQQQLINAMTKRIDNLENK